MNTVIPFGKYKGRSVDEIAEDKQYIDWLCAQQWFRDRHGDLYQVIINNFAEPEDTPEHNKIQAKFLDDNYCFALSRICDSSITATGKARFEVHGIDVMFSADTEYRDDEDKKTWRGSRVVLIEVKPALSDDYPTVLRRMLAWGGYRSDLRILLVGEFKSDAISISQLKDIFLRADIYVVETDEVDRTINQKG